MRTAWVLAGVLGSALPACAQVDLGASVGPETFLPGAKVRREPRPEVLPMPQALVLAFGPQALASVGLSTAPARDLTHLAYRGFYKLELIQLILMSRGSAKPFKEIVKTREEGKSLEAMAGSLKLDYAGLYEEALGIDAEVERLILTLPAAATPGLSTGAVRVGLPDGSTVQAEVAATPEARERGLMFRTDLAEDRGMLFVFDLEGPLTFWMKDTWVDLDIVFLDSQRKVTIVHANVPKSARGAPEDKVARVSGKGRYVLELAAGQAGAHGVAKGNVLEFDPGLAGERSATDGMTEDARRFLKDLLRIDTTSPPGNETEACRYIAGVLAGEGIPYEILESTPGRGSLLARLKGSGSRKPILMLAHLDVVGVERDKWTVDPFAAVEKDGYIYGRGAVDDKDLVASELAVLIALKRSGRRLSRDVLYLAEADEESGGAYGIGWILKHYPGKLRAEYAINEGGSSQLRDGKLQLVSIQAGEKLYHDIRLVARGPSGHASAPLAGNAIYALSRALARLERHVPEPRLNPVTRRYFEGLSVASEDPQFRKAAADIASGAPERLKRGAEALKGGGHSFAHAMLHDTVSPTLVGGGLRVNVIPSEVWANLNVRLLPDSTTEGFVRRLGEVLEEAAVEIQVVTRPEPNPPPLMPADSELFRTFVAVAKGMAPEAVVVPYMSTGATDSEYLRRHGVLAYGIGVPLSQEDESRMHGHDERIPLKSLDFGTRFLYEVVLQAAE